ncbi:hypothetical protein BC943DRAFT_324268 [Umbelopsis sp. AD052]|nr:hypothetical protein BC943DRAFT_324268 [Umbelopsis sp. AD052]
MLLSIWNHVFFKTVFLLNIAYVAQACTVTVYKDSIDCRGYSQTFTGIADPSESSPRCRIRDLFNMSVEYECNTCKETGATSVLTKC